MRPTNRTRQPNLNRMNQEPQTNHHSQYSGNRHRGQTPQQNQQTEESLTTAKGEKLATITQQNNTHYFSINREKNFNVHTAPFSIFFVDRILNRMKQKDDQAVSIGELAPDKALNYHIIQYHDGVIDQIIIENADQERLKGIKHSLRWTLEKMQQKQDSQPPTTPQTQQSQPTKQKPFIETIEDVKALFPSNLVALLTFEEIHDHVRISLKQFVAKEKFAEIAKIIKDAGGEWYNIGKDSHFRITYRGLYTLTKPSCKKTIQHFCSTNTALEQLTLQIIKNKPVFTADDLHALEDEIAKQKRDPRVIGAILSSLAKQGYIEKIGYIKSTRRICHNRPVLQWRALQRTKKLCACVCSQLEGV